MSDNQQINESDLEKQTNEAFGWEATQSPDGSQSQDGSATVEPATETTVAATTEGSTDGTEATATEGGTTEAKPKESVDYAARVKELEEQFKALEGTPYRSVTDAVKGYKELQGEYTKFRERVKPFDSFVDRAIKDPKLRLFLDQAVMGYDNPSLLEAYNQTGKPDPSRYDLFSEDGVKQFQTDTQAYYERSIDQRINLRLGQVEQQANVERAKMEFRSKYPNENPEDVIAYVNERGNNYSLEDYWKLKNFDSLKTKALEDARKELTKQLETASKSGSPVGSSAPKANVKVEDIMAHIAKYGSASATQKFTKAKVEAALMEAT